MPLPAPHERIVPVAVTMVNAPDLSLRGPNGAVAISRRQLRFRRGLPVIQLCTARLPRRFAPRNDTSGSAAVHQCPPAVEWLCTRRSLTAATVKFGSACGRRWLVRAATAFPRLPRRFAPRNDKLGGHCLFNIGPHFPPVQRRAGLSPPLQ